MWLTVLVKLLLAFIFAFVFSFLWGCCPLFHDCWHCYIVWYKPYRVISQFFSRWLQSCVSRYFWYSWISIVYPNSSLHVEDQHEFIKCVLMMWWFYPWTQDRMNVSLQDDYEAGIWVSCASGFIQARMPCIHWWYGPKNLYYHNPSRPETLTFLISSSMILTGILTWQHLLMHVWWKIH